MARKSSSLSKTFVWILLGATHSRTGRISAQPTWVVALTKLAL